MSKLLRKSLLVLLALFLVSSNLSSIKTKAEEKDDNKEPYSTESNNNDFYLDNEKTYNDDDIVRVVVLLDEPSALEKGYYNGKISGNRSLKNYRIHLRNEQDKIKKNISNVLNKTIDVKYQLTLSVNGFSSDVMYGDIDTIKQINGVKDVLIADTYQPLTSFDDNSIVNYTYNSGEIVESRYNGYTGVGSRIAIIDTGLDLLHISFDGDAYEYSIDQKGIDRDEYDIMDEQTVDRYIYDYDYDENQHIVYLLNSENHASFYNMKVPYVFDYVSGGAYWDINVPLEDEIGHFDGESNHGSHVAGIAAGNKYVKVDGQYVDALDYARVVGMAPDAQLCIMKVFGFYPCTSDVIVAALEDALALGCNVANLSLGSDYGLSHDVIFQKAFDVLNNETDMIVAVAIGNAGEYKLSKEKKIEDVSYNTSSSPGTLVNSLSVAAGKMDIANYKSIANDYYYINDTFGSYIDHNRNNKNPFDKLTMQSVLGEYEYIYIDRYGKAEDIAKVASKEDLSSKVVMLNFGGLPGSTQMNNVGPYDPVACVLLNKWNDNVFSSVYPFKYDYDFPVALFDNEGYTTVKENADEVCSIDDIVYYKGVIRFLTTREIDNDSRIQEYIEGIRENTIVDYYSSWGGAGSLLMKPEITAPGTGIYSVMGAESYPNPNKPTVYNYMDHQSYGRYSGTSMATPHIAGLVANLSQYFFEDGISIPGYTTRSLIQSVLMSTAVPLKVDGNYISILQQGAGLVNLKNAIDSHVFIIMDENDNTLTAKTGAAKDGKVKVELGDDPERKGVYSYSFRVYNWCSLNIQFESPTTDVFTQGHYKSADQYYLSKSTVLCGDQISYTWVPNRLLDTDANIENKYDVNLDGFTNDLDVQTILDYISGNINGSNINLEVADIDGDRIVSSYDANILLTYLNDHPTTYVPGNGYADVTITFSFDVDDDIYVNGAYIEGFTQLAEKPTDSLRVATHTIPILGFYGDWTDASAGDYYTYLDHVYGTVDEEKVYTDEEDQVYNYFSVRYDRKAKEKFIGNRYFVEEECPYDRFALNENAVICGSTTVALRAPVGATGYAVYRTDSLNGAETELLYAIPTTSSLFKMVDLTGIGLSEGDTFRLKTFHIPEYVLMKYHYDLYGNMSDASLNKLDENEMKDLLERYEIHDGCFRSYNFTMDNTAPKILNASYENHQFVLEAEDNLNLAYLAFKSTDGSVIYAESAPGSKTGRLVYSNDELFADPNNEYIVAFVADYAGNETVRLIRVNGPTDNSVKLVLEDSDGKTSIVNYNQKDNSVNALYELNNEIDIISAIPMFDADNNILYYVVDANRNMYSLSDNGVLSYLNKLPEELVDVAPGAYKWQQSLEHAMFIDGDSNLVSYHNTQNLVHAVLDTSKFSLNARFISITAQSLGKEHTYVYRPFYYLLDNNGGLWLTELILYKELRYTSSKIFTLAKICDLDIDINDGSICHIYYDEPYLYLSVSDGVNTDLYLCFPDTGSIELIYSFEDTVIKGIFGEPGDSMIINVDAKDDPNDGNDDNLHPNGFAEKRSLDNISTTEIKEKKTSSNTKEIISNTTISTVITPPADKDDISIDICYEDAVANSYVTINYTPRAIVFAGIDSNLRYKSVNVDDENGIIKIVFANGEAIDPDAILASVHFKATRCVYSQINVVTSEKNENLNLNETKTIDIEAQHNWKFAKIEWNMLSSTPKAYVLYICSDCGAPSGYISMTVTKKVKPLWTEYTAYISADDSLDGEAHTSTKKVMKPIIPREWSVLEEKKIVELKPFRP